MKKGQISESVFKRSVLRQIKTHRDEVIKGAGVGEDCAFLAWKKSSKHAIIDNDVANTYTGVSSQTVALPIRNAAYLAAMAAANSLAASGGQPVAMQASIVLPVNAEEALLKELTGQLEKSCEQCHAELAGVEVQVCDTVTAPVITVTALGEVQVPGEVTALEDVSAPNNKEQTVAEMDLVVTKWIGLEGTSIIAHAKEAELATRYPMHLIHAAQGFERLISVALEAALAMRSDVCRLYAIRNGGIFGALWEISRLLGVGLSIDLLKIPVKQETIEVCEFFDVNPYVLLSGGSLLIVTPDGETLVKELEEAGIPAAVIGQTNNSNDKVVTNREEVRYLEPTQPDEIMKLSFN